MPGARTILGHFYYIRGWSPFLLRPIWIGFSVFVYSEEENTQEGTYASWLQWHLLGHRKQTFRTLLSKMTEIYIFILFLKHLSNTNHLSTRKNSSPADWVSKTKNPKMSRFKSWNSTEASIMLIEQDIFVSHIWFFFNIKPSNPNWKWPVLLFSMF